MKEWRSKSTANKVMELMQKKNTIIIFDNETTGLNPKLDEIIEIGAVKYQIKPNHDLVEIERFNVYIKPFTTLKPMITEVTGITNEMLVDKPDLFEVFPRVKEFFGTGDISDIIISGYNVDFDIKFLKRLYELNDEKIDFKNSIDVLEMARDKVAKGETKDYKLGTIAHYFEVDEGIKFHSALDDVIATKNLFDIFCSEYFGESKNLDTTFLKPIPKIQNINFWESRRPGWNRIYVNTDLGSVYYCIRSKKWFTNPKEGIDMKNVDMESLQTNVWNAVGVDNQNDFGKFTGRMSIT